MVAKRKQNLGDKVGGGCALLIFGGILTVFLVAGLAFSGFIVADFVRTARPYGWNELPCEIVSSRIPEEDSGRGSKGYYRFEVEYRYQVRGETYTSRQLSVKDKRFADYSEVQRLADRYAPEAKTVCYVNPSAPEEAVLQQESLWFGLAIVLPLVFVAVGGGGFFFLGRAFIRNRRGGTTGSPGTKRAVSEPVQPLSERVGPGRARALSMIIFGLFFVVGLVLLYVFAIRPMWRIMEAREWQKVPCVVVSSEVRRHASSDGTTYSVNILYAYEINGREYRANRYSFVGGSTSGYSGKAKIVRQYRPGTRTFCYVNPEDLTEAVLVREFTRDLLWGLLPLAFLLAGLVGLVYSARSKKARTRSRSSSAVPLVPSTRREALAGGLRRDATHTGDAPKVLKPGTTPFGKLLIAILIAAFWNGIVSVFVWQAIQAWSKGRPEWFLMIFLVPFVVIGLGLIGFVVYTGLALFNPRPKVILTPGAPALGETVEVDWEISGRTQVLRRLRITLEGREEAQYRRGTRTVTDKNTFARIVLTDTTDRLGMTSGKARVTIPSDLMHSWSSTHNKIAWMLCLHGDIDWWPDLDDEFPLTVEPHKSTAAT